MKPLAGEYASALFAFGLFNASVFAASILPLSTAYSIFEGMGWESGVDKKTSEAPWFYGFYFALIFLGASGARIVLFPNAPLIMMMYLSQVASGVLLPFVLIYMLRLINDRRLMGSYANSSWYNITAWISVWVMTGLTILLVTTLFPNILG